MFSRKFTINATPRQCYDVITDFKQYPKFLDNLKKIEITKKKGNTCDVTYHTSLIKKITYTLHMILDPKSYHVGWELVEGEYMRENNGSWELKEIKKGQTQATYRIDIKFGFLVPGFVSKMLAEQHLPEMLKAFKERIEGM